LVTPLKPSAGQPEKPADQKRKLPSDPAEAFAQLAAERVNGALVRCEQRFPDSGPHSVLVVVVERDPAQWSEKLKSIHAEVCGPGKSDPLAPVQLEILDRATDEAIQRLMAAGLICKTTRAVRPLFPESDVAGPAPLTPEEVAGVKRLRAGAARKLKMARVLGEGGFNDEARPAILDAMHGLARALAVEHRLPEPAELKAALLPPLSHYWQNALPALQAYLQESAADWRPVAECLGAV